MLTAWTRRRSLALRFATTLEVDLLLKHLSTIDLLELIPGVVFPYVARVCRRSSFWNIVFGP